ncbi:MAG: DMT family transporter [Bacteroidales bacterium]
MKPQNKAYLYAISAILLWSTIASAFKVTLQYINHYQLLLLASFFSCLTLFVILIGQKKISQLKELRLKDYIASAILGFLNPFLYYLTLLKAYSLLKAQEAGTLNYIWPITLVLLSIPILKQKIGWKSVLAILVSFLGIIIISTEGRITTLEFREPIGVSLAIGSSIFWALYWIFNMKDKRDESVKLFVNFVFGTGYTFIFVLSYSGFELINLNGLIGSFYIGLFEMGITFFLWLMALKYSANTAKISNLVYISPFISLIIISILVGEKILFATVAGLAFIVGGIILQQLSGRYRKKPV